MFVIVAVDIFLLRLEPIAHQALLAPRQKIDLPIEHSVELVVEPGHRQEECGLHNFKGFR